MTRVVTIFAFSWFKPAQPSWFRCGCHPLCDLIANLRKRGATQLLLYSHQYVFLVIPKSPSFFIAILAFRACAQSFFACSGAILAPLTSGRASSLWDFPSVMFGSIVCKKVLGVCNVYSPFSKISAIFEAPADMYDPSLPNGKITEIQISISDRIQFSKFSLPQVLDSKDRKDFLVCIFTKHW